MNLNSPKNQKVLQMEQMTVEGSHPDGLDVCYGPIRPLVVDIFRSVDALLRSVEDGDKGRRAFPIPACKLQGGYVPVEPFSGKALERFSCF